MEDNGHQWTLKTATQSQTWDPARGEHRQELGLLTFAERLGLLSLAENVESLDEWRPMERPTPPTAWADSDGDLLWQHHAASLDRLMTRS